MEKIESAQDPKNQNGALAVNSAEKVLAVSVDVVV
jgi:hypothetical protein